MKFYRIIFLSIIFSFTSSYFGQEIDSSKVQHLKNVYSNLEYNTIAFDDLKGKWQITDPLLIREIFNRFIVNDAVRLNSKELLNDSLRILSRKVQTGDIIIDLRKRYYDDEIEYFAFLPVEELDKENPKYFIDPINDGFYLKKILGEELYLKVKDKGYFFYDITKDVYQSEVGYNFDVNLSLFDPYVMFWSTTSNFRNKYLLSLFGKWGEDYIFLPGWFSSDYILGAKLNFRDVLTQDPNNYMYELAVGIAVPAGKPFTSVLPSKSILRSGESIYFKISGQPLKYMNVDFDKFFVNLEGMFTVTDFNRSDFKPKAVFEFTSIRDYLVFKLNKKDLFNLFDFGQFEFALGVSTHSIFNYIVDPASANLIDTSPKTDWTNKFSHFVFSEIGIEKRGGLMQYSLSALFGQNIVDDYNYVGVNARAMLSDTFGVEMKYYTALKFDKIKYPYRSDTYFVFSPIFRINY